MKMKSELDLDRLVALAEPYAQYASNPTIRELASAIPTLVARVREQQTELDQAALAVEHEYSRATEAEAKVGELEAEAQVHDAGLDAQIARAEAAEAALRHEREARVRAEANEWKVANEWQAIASLNVDRCTAADALAEAAEGCLIAYNFTALRSALAAYAKTKEPK